MDNNFQRYAFRSSSKCKHSGGSVDASGDVEILHVDEFQRAQRARGRSASSVQITRRYSKRHADALHRKNSKIMKRSSSISKLQHLQKYEKQERRKVSQKYSMPLNTDSSFHIYNSPKHVFIDLTTPENKMMDISASETLMTSSSSIQSSTDDVCSSTLQLHEKLNLNNNYKNEYVKKEGSISELRTESEIEQAVNTINMRNYLQARASMKSMNRSKNKDENKTSCMKIIMGVLMAIVIILTVSVGWLVYAEFTSAKKMNELEQIINKHHKSEIIFDTMPSWSVVEED